MLVDIGLMACKVYQIELCFLYPPKRIIVSRLMGCLEGPFFIKL
jgi:hypothetical protein